MTHTITARENGEFHIITNNHPRDLINSWELTPAERERFDYVDWNACEAGTDSFQCFAYRGELYDVSDGFMSPTGSSMWSSPLPADHPIVTQGWHGYQSNSNFSGLLIKYTNDKESVIVGRYYC